MVPSRRSMRAAVTGGSIALAMTVIVEPAIAAEAIDTPGSPREVALDATDPARTPQKQRDWHLALEAVTNAPVDIGGRLLLQTPLRFRLATGFGAIPSAYAGLVNQVIYATGAYDALVANAVDAAFHGGTVWRSQIGWQPFRRAGLYIDAGYARVNLSGNIVGQDVAPVLGQLNIDNAATRSSGYSLHTTLHMWLAEVGWQGTIAHRLSIGIGVGVMGTISAKTDATANFAAGQSAVGQALSTTAIDRFDHQVETRGYLPTLNLRIGYRFF